MGLAEGPQPTLDQRRIGQDPAVQGGVVDLQAALDEQLLDVTIAERIAQVPGDGLQDQRRLEVAALEIVLRPALQPLDKGTQDHGSPPTSEAQTHPACSTRGKRPEFATCVDAPLGAREIFESGVARGRVLTCVRPLVRLTRRGPRWESGDQVQNKGSPPQAAGYFRREPTGGFRVASGSPGLAS